MIPHSPSAHRRAWTRRLALLLAWRAGALVALGAVPVPWYAAPPRIVQTLLREPDVVDYDVAAVVAHLKAVRANCIVINGGGVIDFFRHDHPMANPTAYLGDRDILAELTAACRREGIRVLARVDFRGVERARFDRRPEWFALDAEGRPAMRESGLHYTCFNGGYRNEYGLHLIRQLLARYEIDGIWYNAVQSAGACYCAECSRKYRAATGADIPKVEDTMTAYLGDEMATYRRLKAGWALEHLGRVRDLLKSFGPDRALTVEIFGMYAARPGEYGGVDVATVSPVVDVLLGKVFVDEDDEPATAGSTIRYLRALDANKPVVLLTSTNRNKFRLMSENPLEVETALWEGVAAGGGIWNALVAGANPDTFADRRNARTAAPAFHYLADHADRLAGMQPIAEAKILFSTATRAHSGAGFRPALEGAERALAENHVPYTFLPSDQLGPAALADTKVLLLPNVTVLSDREVGVLREYVRGGGTLVADFQTSLFSTGGTRDDFALGDVFGVTTDGKVFADGRNSPHRIRVRHPLLAGWEDTGLLLNGGRTLRCRTQGAEVVATRIPVPPGPVPESGWIRGDTDEVTVAVNRFGRGRAIYFAHEIMRQSRVDGHPDFTQLLAAATRHALGAGTLLTTNAPASVRISLLENRRGGYVVSLVNHASATGRPMRGRVPVRDIAVRLRLPEALRAWSTLHADSAIAVSPSADGAIAIRLTELQGFAAVAIETGR